MQTPTWRDLVPDAVAGLVVLGIGGYSIQNQYSYGRASLLVVVLGFAVAVGVARRQPLAALALVWAIGFYQLAGGTPVLFIEVAVGYVAFACARWGHVATVVLSGLSIPAAAVVVSLTTTADALVLLGDLDRTSQLLDAVHRFSDTWQVGAAVFGVLALGAPWLAGLALRAVARAQRSETAEASAQEDAARAQHEAAQAQEIARLRDDQARLARDVHDVVGHSLAVILAQAEAAQYLPDDPIQLKETMATIAGSARTSLQDVRQVLTQANEPARPASFEALVEGVRRTGQVVEVDEVGTPRPLPPELDVVAYRVMQEMLTNAVKHGRRDRPVRVERHWPQDSFERDLRLEVSNTTSGPPGDETQPISVASAEPVPPAGGGQGIAGMRRRVESVGGRLDVRRRSGPDGPTFTTTVWVPVRA